MQGWGKVPAAHASDTLHTACLWSEFSGCGQRGGGRSEKGAGAAFGGTDGVRERERSSALQGNIQRRGTGREFRLEVQIRSVRSCEKV